VHDAAEPLVRQGVELDLAGLAHPDLLEVGLRHVGLDLQRLHVGDGDDGGLRIRGGAQGRHDVPDVGVLREHDGIEGGTDEGVFQVHLRRLEGRLGSLDGRLGPRNAGLGLPEPGLGRVKGGLRRVLPGQEPLLPLVGNPRVRQLRPGLVQAVAGDTQVCPGLILRRGGIGTLEPRDDVALLHAAALLDVDLQELGRDLRGDGGLALGHHVTACVENRKRLRGVGLAHRGHVHGLGGAENPRPVQGRRQRQESRAAEDEHRLSSQARPDVLRRLVDLETGEVVGCHRFFLSPGVEVKKPAGTGCSPGYGSPGRFVSNRHEITSSARFVNRIERLGRTGRVFR